MPRRILTLPANPLKPLSSARGALVLICANAYTGLIDVPEELTLFTSLNERVSLLACVRIKPAGMFHQIASFYGIDTRCGVSYKF